MKFRYSILAVVFISFLVLINCGDSTSGVDSDPPQASSLSVEYTGSKDIGRANHTIEPINQRNDASGSTASVNVTTTGKGCQVTANWTQCSSDDFASYTLYRSTNQFISSDTTSATRLTTVSSVSSTEYVDGTVDWETTYYYALITRDKQDLFAWSDEESITTPSSPGGDITITEPTSSTVWEYGQTNTTVSWTGTTTTNVRIEIWQSGTKLDDFADWVPNTGSYTRTAALPTSWGTGANYQIKVIDDLGYIGLSEEFFINSPESMEFVSIPHGSFEMGAPEGEQGSSSGERPVHTVTFNYDFEMMTTEVTQGMWLEVMGSNPSYFTGDLNRPVECVSWEECQNFVDAMNTLDPSHTYRLPSESEWEYCCRAGTTERFYWGEDPGETVINGYAWWIGNSVSRTHPVAGKLPNDWGLYDMSGNVWEWCEDWLHGSYNGAPSDGSAWLDPVGLGRVYRGGCWGNHAGYCRSANRGYGTPGHSGYYLGVRLVRS